MRYVGSTLRISRELAQVIEPLRLGRPVWEPFCGGLGLSQALSGQLLLSDSSQALISLYRAWQRGWRPPTDVSEEQYRAAKKLPDSDPLKAFVGFGCSWGGKYFGGYARGRKNYAAEAKKLLTKKMTTIEGRSIFAHLDFLVLEPAPCDLLIYCDPPYDGTTKYQRAFDSKKFWQLAKVWARYTTVLVSEYTAPEGTTVIWSRQLTNSLNDQKATEKLFLL